MIGEQVGYHGSSPQVVATICKYQMHITVGYGQYVVVFEKIQNFAYGFKKDPDIHLL